MSTFYKINSTRFSFREYWWGTRSPLVVLPWLIKIFGIPLPASSDDPNVEDLRPFKIEGTPLPPDLPAKLQPLIDQLTALGFHSPVYHLLIDRFHSTRICMVSFCHNSGQGFARIHYRLWTRPHPPKEYLFPMFVSVFRDGTFLWSSSGKPDMEPPPECRMNRIVGASAADLWASHQRELEKCPISAGLLPITTSNELESAIDQHHRVARDFHRRRKAFVPMSETDQKRAHALEESLARAEAGGSEHGEVLAQIQQLQEKKTGWGSALLILAISMALFVGIGSKQWSWEFALMLVPILLFHEAGHYVAMRVFKYRNLRMFFIPMLGAAVSGRHYNVPGWKKVVVSLMGPVPGIILGMMIGSIGILLHQAWLVKVALLTLILNGFNLLPFLPLDGGWVFHTLLFSRHYLLDCGFRILAAVALMLGGHFSHDRILLILGIVMLVGLPISYRTARISFNLRKAGFAPASGDDFNIPAEAAQTIIGEVKKAFPKGLTSKSIAQYAINIFETLNARPPGVLATLGLLVVHLGSGVMAVIFTILLVLV